MKHPGSVRFPDPAKIRRKGQQFAMRHINKNIWPSLQAILLCEIQRKL